LYSFLVFLAGRAEEMYRGAAAITKVVESWFMSQSKVVAAEARGQFGKREEGKRSPLEAVARKLVRTATEDTSMCNSGL
jgi:hypothetical protein